MLFQERGSGETHNGSGSWPPAKLSHTLLLPPSLFISQMIFSQLLIVPNKLSALDGRARVFSLIHLFCTSSLWAKQYQQRDNATAWPERDKQNGWDKSEITIQRTGDPDQLSKLVFTLQPVEYIWPRPVDYPKQHPVLVNTTLQSCKITTEISMQTIILVPLSPGTWKGRVCPKFSQLGQNNHSMNVTMKPCSELEAFLCNEGKMWPTCICFFSFQQCLHLLSFHLVPSEGEQDPVHPAIWLSSLQEWTQRSDHSSWSLCSSIKELLPEFAFFPSYTFSSPTVQCLSDSKPLFQTVNHFKCVLKEQQHINVVKKIKWILRPNTLQKGRQWRQQVIMNPWMNPSMKTMNAQCSLHSFVVSKTRGT